MGRACHTKDITDDHGAPGHSRLPDGRHGAYAVLDGAGLFGLEADQKAGAINQIDHRQMKGLRQVDELFDFLTGVRSPGTAVEKRITRHQRHGPAIEAGKAGDDRAAVQRSDFEKRPLVHHCLDDRSHLVDFAHLTWHRGEQPLRAALRVIGLWSAWWQVVDRRGQIGEKASGAGKGLFLSVHSVINGTGFEVDLIATQLGFREILSQTRHHWWPGHEQGGCFLYHDRVMRRGQMRRTEASDRPQAKRDTWHCGHVPHHPFPARHARYVGAATGFDGFYRAAAA